MLLSPLVFKNFILCVCVLPACVPGVCGGQKRVSSSLELELRMVLNHHVGAWNQTQVLCKTNKCSSLYHDMYDSPQKTCHKN